MTTDEITYVDADPLIPGHLPAGHVHHRGSDRCLRNDDGAACPSPAESRARVRELEAEVERLVRWRRSLLDEGFGYDDSEESCAEVLEWAPIWRAQSAGDEHRADAAEAERDALQQRLANVQALADARGGEVHQKDAAIWPWEIDSALAAPAVSSRPGMTVTEAVADALNDRSENTGQITGGTPHEPQPTPEARLCCEHCQPDSGEETRYCDRTHCDSCAACAARQSEPVERITDANGDELERGADTDAQTAQQQDGSDR